MQISPLLALFYISVYICYKALHFYARSQSCDELQLPLSYLFVCPRLRLKGGSGRIIVIFYIGGFTVKCAENFSLLH